MKKTHLQNAKAKKDDEFYTRFEDIEKDFREIPNLCIPQTVIENRNLNINLDKIVSHAVDRLVYLFERNKENKIIEPYSVKNYFTRVLLNYDPTKIQFLTEK